MKDKAKVFAARKPATERETGLAQGRAALLKSKLMEQKGQNNCNLFERYCKGKLSAKEREMFKKHLKKCPLCRDRAEALPADAGGIFPSEPPFGGKLTEKEKKELKKKILERIEKENLGDNRVRSET